MYLVYKISTSCVETKIFLKEGNFTFAPVFQNN